MSQLGFSDNIIEINCAITEHTIIANELISDAYRKNKDIIIMTLDFVNEFGSIPHKLIFKTMEEWLQLQKMTTQKF